MAEREFDYVAAGRALRRYFQSRGHPDPEDAAQEAIARLLEQSRGKDVRDPEAYLKGIAKNILKDCFKQRNLEALPAPPPPERVDERLLACLERCARKLLTSAERRLLKDWYTAHGADKIALRRRLAETAGITPDALKTRVHRLRQRLAPHLKKFRAALEQS